MSLVAASLMKSSVLGAMPRAELTPVCSPTDWPKAAELKAVTSAADKMNFNITVTSSRFGVDRADGQFRERIIGFLFLGQRLVEKLDGVLVTELSGPCFQRAVTGNLVMLNSLGGGQQTGIERRCVGILIHDFLAFVEDALDGVALFTAGRLADEPENLFQPFDLTFGLVMVLLEGRSQLIRVGRFGHLWKRFINLLLRVIDIFQGIDEQLVEIFLGHGVLRGKECG